MTIGTQPTLSGFGFENSAGVDEAIQSLAIADNSSSRGAIYTRTEVVEFILDLIGYRTDQPLFQRRLLEPSFGNADFLLSIIERLLESWRRSQLSLDDALPYLKNALRAVELHHNTFKSSRLLVIETLIRGGIPDWVASSLADVWLLQGDFLLNSRLGKFDYVAGNPPYVRQEIIPDILLAEYRLRFSTIFDRADLYVPFIEKSLLHLDTKGILGFICADRWTKNKYGGPLRKFVATGFHLRAYVDMGPVEAFHSGVSAYPAVMIVANEKTAATRIAECSNLKTATLSRIVDELDSAKISGALGIREVEGIVKGSEPWLFDSSERINLIRHLERQFPTLEQAGCKIGIGVATGADKAFIGNFDDLDIESDRKIPLVATRDIKSGEVDWFGKAVVNPFADDGTLVDLGNYPKLKAYLDQRRDAIAKRHCAQKSPNKWYRTIDRIWPELQHTRKLLIPDIKGDAHVVYEAGKLYPHHNLYYVTSEGWELRALQAVLLSNIARLFVATYSTKMRGGYLRFQAQYLRRIRVPYWDDVPPNIRDELTQAATTRDLEACNFAVLKLYKLSKEDAQLLVDLKDTDDS